MYCVMRASAPSYIITSTDVMLDSNITPFQYNNFYTFGINTIIVHEKRSSLTPLQITYL